MTHLSNAEMTVLSLVAEKSCHGYEMEQIIEQRGVREWTELGFSSIYFLLHKLECSKFIRSRLEPSGGKGPARKIYSITAAGHAELVSAIFDSLSTPRPCRLPIQLGLANLPMIEEAAAADALARYQDQLKDRISQIEQRWNSQKPLPFFVDAMFTHSLCLMRAELEWIRQFRCDYFTKGTENG